MLSLLMQLLLLLLLLLLLQLGMYQQLPTNELHQLWVGVTSCVVENEKGFITIWRSYILLHVQDWMLGLTKFRKVTGTLVWPGTSEPENFWTVKCVTIETRRLHHGRS